MRLGHSIEYVIKNEYHYEVVLLGYYVDEHRSSIKHIHETTEHRRQQLHGFRHCPGKKGGGLGSRLGSARDCLSMFVPHACSAVTAVAAIANGTRDPALVQLP